MKWLEQSSDISPEKKDIKYSNQTIDKESRAKISIKKNSKIELSENSRLVLEKRYLRKGIDGKPDETVEEMFDRIANTVAEPDSPYRDVSVSQIEFFNLLTSKRFFPNSPTFTGAGTPLGQLSGCYVLPISDDLGKDFDGIFSTLRTAALIQQVGGGNGFSFSDLRPRGSIISTSGGLATGPVGFLKVYDKAFGEVAQGGIRRGANMAVLRVDHPDIREFIMCKSDEGDVSNFNISIAVTDEFMRAVKEDGTYDLVAPNTRQVVESPRAREIFDMIVLQAHKNGEPGVLFIDKANETNPVPHLYVLKATNPCGEQWLGPYDNCCLGSINLAQHLSKDGGLDWDMLEETTVLSMRFLDNVVTANKYVSAIPQLRQAAEDSRRVGLGFMGLADVLYSMGIRYGSEEAQEFSAQMTEYIRYHSMLASIELARERGPFPKISGSIYDPEKLVWKPPVSLKPFLRNYGRPEVNWISVVAAIREYGIRNAAQMCVAPTGTISTVAGVEGYGCEPVFAIAYNRNVYQAAGDDKHLTLEYTSPLFLKTLHNLGIEGEREKAVIDKVIETGTCRGISELSKEIKDVFVVSADITPEEHILMQASIQAFVDNSISKTCNFPIDATKEDVAEAYIRGWELGCKGLTVYVTGSREEVVLETKETRKRKSDDIVMERVPRGYRLSGATYKVPTPQGKAFVTVNKDENNFPIEVFVNVGKAGTDVAALSEALGRLLSGWLRASRDPVHTVREIVVQLIDIGGTRRIGYGSNRVGSIPDAVAKVLAEEFNVSVRFNGDVQGDQGNNNLENAHYFSVRADMCPECGNSALVQEEGCAKCYLCGYSIC